MAGLWRGLLSPASAASIFSSIDANIVSAFDAIASLSFHWHMKRGILAFECQSLGLRREGTRVSK